MKRIVTIDDLSLKTIRNDKISRSIWGDENVGKKYLPGLEKMSYVIIWYKNDTREYSSTAILIDPDERRNLFWVYINGKYGYIRLSKHETDDLMVNNGEYHEKYFPEIQLMDKALRICQGSWFDEYGEMYEIPRKEFDAIIKSSFYKLISK